MRKKKALTRLRLSPQPVFAPDFVLEQDVCFSVTPMTNDPVPCPVCASDAPQICAYDNHANAGSPVSFLKDCAARIGWHLLGILPTTGAASIGRIARKFSAGVFKFHQIHRCDSCDLGFVQPSLKPGHLRRYYAQAYWQDFRSEPQMDVHIHVGQPRSTAQFDLVSAHVDFDRVRHGLEIGPGPGCISQKIKEKHDHISFTAIEPSLDWAENYANAAVFDSFFGDIGDLEEQQKFDLILSSHSLEHVPDLTSFMDTLFRLAKPGAIVFFEVPNCSEAYFKSSHRDQPHTYFFTTSALEKLAGRTGFTVLELSAWGHSWTEPGQELEDNGSTAPNENGDVVRAILQRRPTDD